MGKPTIWFGERSDTNRPVQAQKRARSLKFRRNSTIRVAKTKALISFTVTAKLICAFVFAYADCWFSHEAAQMVMHVIREQLLVTKVMSWADRDQPIISVRNSPDELRRCLKYFLLKPKNVTSTLISIYITQGAKPRFGERR